MANTIRERLRDWRRLATARPTAEDPEDAGGREAERQLKALVGGHFNFKGADLFLNKRVPAGGRRREIDLIVVTPTRLHVIEVKNWSGALAREGTRWVQTNRSGRRIEHPDLVADNRDKDEALVAYLASKGVGLDPARRAKYVSNKVVFVNPRLAIESPEIREHPDVLDAARLDGYLKAQKRQRLGGQLGASIIEWCLGTEAGGAVLDRHFERLSPEQTRAIREAVDELGSWDSLRLFGGKVVNGDLIAVEADGTEVRRDALGRRTTLELRWTRHRFWGLLKAITGLGRLGRLDVPAGPRLPLHPGDALRFHRVGEPKPVEFALADVDAVVLG